MQRIILIAFITSLGCLAAIGLFMIVTKTSGGRGGEVLGSLCLVAAASVLGLVSSFVWSRRIWHPVGIIGLILAPVALVLTLVPVWGRTVSGVIPWTQPTPWWYSKEWMFAIGTAWIAAVAMPHIGLLAMVRLHRRFLWVRRATVVFIAILASFLALVFFDDDMFPSGRFIEQGISILVIFVIFGTLTVPILHRFSSIKPRPFIDTVALQLQITCPRCTLAQVLSVGRSACAQCGLRFGIEIEENLCEKCGYSLYRLESSTCPECGTPILQSSLVKSVD